MKKLLFFWLLALSSVVVAAEQWTPDCEQTIECKTNGVIEVCAINKGLTYQRLRISYQGYLLANPQRTFSVYVNLNGIDGFYPLAVSGEKAGTELNKTKSYLCTKPGIVYPECSYSATKIVYEVDDTNPQKALFKNTFSDGWPKPWQLEIAINAGDEWDSDYGNNFKFRF
jgi:hypothetical protein